jgi:hypothetical protein
MGSIDLTRGTIGFHLIAEAQGGNLDFRPLRGPLSFVEPARRHG